LIIQPEEISVFCHTPSFTSWIEDPTSVSEIEERSKDCVIVVEVLLKELADLILLALVHWLVDVARL
jgi:hypothetical protein